MGILERLGLRKKRARPVGQNLEKSREGPAPSQRKHYAVKIGIMAVLVVAIFFATSSDSGSLVVDMLTNGGDPHPIWQQRLFWAVTEGAVAAILLVAGAAVGGNPLSALQTAAVTSGLPFSIIVAFMCWGLVRQLRTEEIPPVQGTTRKTPAQQRQAAE